MKKEREQDRKPHTDPFQLPNSIVKQLKKCHDAQCKCEETEVAAGRPGVKYLWLHVESGADKPGPRSVGTQPLSLDEWLNVIDEAASLGVHCMLLCVELPLARYPELPALLEWAQVTHGMMVGLYVRGAALEPRDLEAIEHLDASKFCLFVDSERLDMLQGLVGKRVPVFSAAVDEGEHRQPCSIPETMICVASEGTMYTCGLVLGDERFSLGNVFERPLHHVVGDHSLPRRIPGDVLRDPDRKCTACPPLMAKRAAGDAAEPSELGPR